MRREQVKQRRNFVEEHEITLAKARLTEVLWWTARWRGQAAAAGERVPTHRSVRSHQVHACAPEPCSDTQLVQVL